MRNFRASLLCVFLLALWSGAAGAADSPHRSTTLMGQVGLNNVPSARMDQAGTVRIGVGTLDPYLHSFINAQITDWMNVGIRQSAEKSSLLSNPHWLYPGLDLKFTLNREGRYDPEIALGFLSASGHKQTASEYIALSKRYNNFDFTLGMGWGRLAGDGHIRNPMRRISSHFGDNRTFTNGESNSAHDWFTGEDAGFFGGVEYHTPLKNLSLKADWGSNPYGVEADTINGYDKPADWSLSLNYAPLSWVDAMVGIQGTDKVMARLSFQDNVARWLGRPAKSAAPPAIFPRRADSDPEALRDDARDDGIYLGHIRRERDTGLAAHLNLRAHKPLAQQIGHAARLMARHAPPETDTFYITPMRGRIAGKPIRILRRDLEIAITDHQGSPEEIWNNTVFGGIDDKKAKKFPFLLDFNLSLQNDLSLSERDDEYIYRSALVGRARADLPDGYFAGIDLKLNLKDNLKRINDRYNYWYGVRGNVDDFTRRRIYLERAYGGWRGQVLPDVFVSNTAGAVEEMHLANGTEILYRPFGKTWALGAEAWLTYKRVPDDIWGLDRIDSGHLSGHLNFYYEIPDTNITVHAKAGQYLAGDRGATIGVSHEFRNGATLSAFGTATDEADFDLMGGTSHIHSGITLTLPLGNVPYVPSGSDIVTRIAPQGRHTGQFIDNPEPLYRVTEPVSYRGASQSWHRLLD